MKAFRFSTLLVALMLITATASMAQRVEFKGFERVTHLSTSGANLWVVVENNSCWRMVVKEAEVDILVGDKPRLSITIRDKIVVPRKSCSEVLIPLRFTSRSMLSFAGVIARMAFGDRDDITINYKIKAGTPLFKRKLEGCDTPLNALLELLAMPEEEIDILNELVK